MAIGGFDPDVYQPDAYQNEGAVTPPSLGGFQCGDFGFQPTAFQNVCGETPPAPIEVGGGGAGWIYKPRHKKVYDEIEEYFACRAMPVTPREIERAAEAIYEAIGIPDEDARDNVSEAMLARAMAATEVVLNARRNAELMELLKAAQDEDDAIAVMIMMETLH